MLIWGQVILVMILIGAGEYGVEATVTLCWAHPLHITRSMIIFFICITRSICSPSLLNFNFLSVTPFVTICACIKCINLNILLGQCCHTFELENSETWSWVRQLFSNSSFPGLVCGDQATLGYPQSPPATSHTAHFPQQEVGFLSYFCLFLHRKILTLVHMIHACFRWQHHLATQAVTQLKELTPAWLHQVSVVFIFSSKAMLTAGCRKPVLLKLSNWRRRWTIWLRVAIWGHWQVVLSL